MQIRQIDILITLHRLVGLSTGSMMAWAHFASVKLRTGAFNPRKLLMALTTLACLIDLKKRQLFIYIYTQRP